MTTFAVHFEKPTVVNFLIYLVFSQLLFSIVLGVALLSDLPLTSPILILYWITNFWHIFLYILGIDLSEKYWGNDIIHFIGNFIIFMLVLFFTHFNF